MAQSDRDIVYGSDSIAVYYALINAIRNAARSCWSGTAAPTSPLLGQLWLDTDTPSATTNTLSIYDGANWVTIGTLNTTTHVLTLSPGALGALTMSGILNMGAFKIENVGNGDSTDDAANIGQVQGMVHTLSFRLGSFAAAANKLLMVSPGKLTITKCTFTADANITGDASNHYDLVVRNVTAGVNIASKNFVANVAANVVTNLGTITNATPAVGDLIRLELALTLAPTGLAAADTLITIEFTTSIL